MKDRLDEPGTGLSGGQQQRLCIARAIAVNPEVILMDEPCSALDPIATARVEELIDELRQNYTIVIVTHSMQQAARVSQRTAMFHLGYLVEEGPTDRCSPIRASGRRRTTSPAASAERTRDGMAQHIVTSFEDELQGLARSIAEMGGRAEQLVERSITALLRSDPDLAHEVIEADKKVDELQRQIEERAILVIARRQPMAQDLRETIAAIRIANDLERIGDLGKNIAKRALAIQKPDLLAEGARRRRASGRARRSGR